jgi:hypothetical protein
MACRQFTLQEFENLPSGTRGFSSPEECSCCDQGCCYAQQYYNHFGVTQSEGWVTTHPDDGSALGGKGTVFRKSAPCGTEVVLSWNYEGDSETYTYTLTADSPGNCCGDTCVTPDELVNGWEKLGYGSTEECQAAGVNFAACDAPTCP